MARQYASLERIDHNRRITRETDHAFLYRLQGGLLTVMRVEVTPETVQNVVSTLFRAESYYRELTVGQVKEHLAQRGIPVRR